VTLRRQPAAYSPVTLRNIWVAAAQTVRRAPDAVAALARLLSREYSAATTLLLGSGTQALQVALQVALRHAGGSTVALPAFTCFDVASAAVGAGAGIELYDMDPATLSPDLESLGRALERGACVAVINPLYGFPVDWDAVDTVLARHGAVGVEDAAQGFQAMWRGRAVGSFGPLSVLSFGRGKGWTGGSGGALLVRGSAAGWDVDRPSAAGSGGWADLRVLCHLLGQWALGRPTAYSLPAALPWLRLGETVYRGPRLPRRMTGAAAACLEAGRGAAEREAAARRANGTALLAAIAPTSDVRAVRPLAGATASFLRLPVRLAQGLAGFETPARAAGLGVVRAYPSLLAGLPPVRARMVQGTGHWPGAEELAGTLFTAVSYTHLTLPTICSV